MLKVLRDVLFCITTNFLGGGTFLLVSSPLCISLFILVPNTS